MGTKTNQPHLRPCDGCLGTGGYAGKDPRDTHTRCDACDGYGHTTECPWCKEPVGGNVAYACGEPADIHRGLNEAIANGDKLAQAGFARAIEDLSLIEATGLCGECDAEDRRVEERQSGVRLEEHTHAAYCLNCERRIADAEPSFQLRDVRLCTDCGARIASALGRKVA